ncbi:hypothetical protein GE061_014078, partial [Apolygus lucorum]
SQTENLVIALRDRLSGLTVYSTVMLARLGVAQLLVVYFGIT